MNKTRELYRRIMQGQRPDDIGTLELIQASEDFKKLLEHPGYKRVKKFMNTQRDGSTRFLERETTNITVFSLGWLFNTFIKYLAVLLEQRAYNRIETYISVTIQRGEEKAKALEKLEKQKNEQKEMRF